MEIKKSKKPIKYADAIRIMEKRLHDINQGIAEELVWILEHEEIYTAGKNYKDSEIIDKSIKIVKTTRGGKITYHGPGQRIIYLMLNLRKNGYDIRKFISLIEEWIITSLKDIGVKGVNDRDHVGIWIKDKNNLKGRNAKYNSEQILEIFSGKSNEFSQSVALNVAAGLIVSGKENNFKNAFDKATKHLSSGEVFEHLTKLQSK